MPLSIQSLPPIRFCSESGERELRPGDHANAIRGLAELVAKEFPDARRIGLIWHTEPELVLLWLAILASGREPLLLQYPNEKQGMVHWRESLAVSVDIADLGGIVVGDDPRLRDLDFIRTFCPPAGSFQRVTGGNGELAELSFDGAFLQMSSGTTGHRKPIRFELSDVATHVRQYNLTVELGPDDRMVSWLPLYHDMGFIACFLMPLLLRIPLVLIDPMVWIRRPALLSETIRKHRGTVCYMPNFGFEVMSRQGGDAAMPTMRRWISCSEPAYPETMQRFSSAFQVPASALSVCYAMAENIFAVTFGCGLREFSLGNRQHLSCGAPIAGTELKIHDDGEIWVRSEISLKNYFNSTSIVDGEGYYPTGDLGVMIDGELVVTGRKRDLVNIAGRKYMLNDIDQALQALVPESQGRAAAVSWRNAGMGTETPLLLVESADFYMRTDQRAIGGLLGKVMGIESAEVVFVPPRFIAKTSSGKTNRLLTAEYYRRALTWQQEGARGRRSLDDSLADYYSDVPWDSPISELFDSLGLTSLSILLDQFDVTLNPRQSIEQHLDSYRTCKAAVEATGASGGGYFSIVSLADARLTRQWSDEHLEAITRAVGVPVSFEYLCLPPVPVVLSDLVFHDYFLPREDDKEKYRDVLTAIETLKKASIVLVDDVAELLFGERFFPFLDHRFRRSEQADLLIYRWQQYARNHHNLPIGVANLSGTVGLRNEYIDRLARYLGAPVFRIAALKSQEPVTRAWDYVDRVNADWTMELESDSDAMVAALAAFMAKHKENMRRLQGTMRKGIRHVGLVHFCCMAADKNRLDDLIDRYDRFCIYGPQASLPYLRKRLEASGKSYVNADQSANLAPLEERFDCVAQVGATGKPVTDKPAFQIFWAAWEYEADHHAEAYAGLNSRSFHADPAAIRNELPLVSDLPSTPGQAIRVLKQRLRESEKMVLELPGDTRPVKNAGRRFPPEVYPEFLPADQTNYAEAERLIAAGQTDQGYALIENMVESGTALWQPYNDLGARLFERGEHEAAIFQLRVAASLERGATQALRNLAAVCAQAGRLADALTTCAKILEAEPTDASVPEFIRDVLLAAKPSFEDRSWLLPEWTAQQREVDRLRLLETRYAQQSAQLRVKDHFIDQARRVLDNLP